MSGGSEQQKAFVTLKSILTSNLIVRLPHIMKPFIAHTDTSRTSLGVSLSQDYNGDLMPVTFASRRLNKHEINDSELECLALVFALSFNSIWYKEFHLYNKDSVLFWLLNHP